MTIMLRNEPVIALLSSLLFLGFAGGCSASTNKEAPTVFAPNTVIPSLPADLYEYANPVLPAHFSVESERFHRQRPLLDSDNTPADNLTTNAGATLGRVLFYDENLSQKHIVACASCHKQALGFSDDAVLSVGFDGGSTKRHSMGLTNARFYGQGRFFWDQRAATLEQQVLMPFQDPVEMGMTLEGLRKQVQSADYYAPLFEAAFGSKEITTDKIAKALAQFVRSMVSFESKYDKGRAQVARRSDPFPNFTEQENHGKKLFVSPPPMGGFGCFVCHQGEGFIAQRAMNNGLDARSPDPGYSSVTNKPSDEGMFKVPSLRNVATRPPYMHDGRFGSLADVIDHYSDNIQPNENLGPPFFLRDGVVRQIHMSVEDKAALVAFLRTLTDESFLKDPKYSNPFVSAEN